VDLQVARVAVDAFAQDLCAVEEGFAVADVVAKRAELEAKGINCEAIRIDEYTGKPFFFIKDPDGLPLEFYQQ